MRQYYRISQNHVGREVKKITSRPFFSDLPQIDTFRDECEFAIVVFLKEVSKPLRILPKSR